MNDYTPQADKAELHLTYRCDLDCPGCNRACFLLPATPDMSLTDAREFFLQAHALNWHPRIMLIGGEPTLHPDFLAFVDMAAQFTGDPSRVEVWSNGHSNRAADMLDQVRRHGKAAVQEGTIKTASVTHPTCDIFLAPADYNEHREPCGTHSCFTDPDCGISVDSLGYTICCMGGAIAGHLGLDVRTTRLADLFDPEKAARQTRALCDYCGQHLGIDARKISQAQVIAGTLMSPTWAAAASGLPGASGRLHRRPEPRDVLMSAPGISDPRDVLVFHDATE